MMLCLEDLSEDELKKVKAKFELLAASPSVSGHAPVATEQADRPQRALNAVE
jgi:hypothetical protein